VLEADNRSFDQVAAERLKEGVVAWYAAPQIEAHGRAAPHGQIHGGDGNPAG